MKKNLLAVFSALFIMGCSQENIQEKNDLKNGMPSMANTNMMLIEKDIVNLKS